MKAVEHVFQFFCTVLADRRGLLGALAGGRGLDRAGRSAGAGHFGRVDVDFCVVHDHSCIFLYELVYWGAVRQVYGDQSEGPESKLVDGAALCVCVRVCG